MLNIQRIARQLAAADGSEILEAALVLPLLFMLLLGIVWFGRAFNIYSTIQQAAQQGAITAARPSCATCSQASPWGTTSFPSDTTVTGVVEGVLKASNLDPTQIKTWNPGLSAVPVSPWWRVPTTDDRQHRVCRNVQLNPAGQPLQCGTMVSFQYPFQFYLPFTSLNMQKIVLSAQAQSRMEN